MNPEDLRRFAAAPISGRCGKAVMWQSAAPEIRRVLFMASGPGLRRWLLNHLPVTPENRRERIELKELMEAEVLTLEEIPQQAITGQASPTSSSSTAPQHQQSL